MPVDLKITLTESPELKAKIKMLSGQGFGQQLKGVLRQAAELIALRASFHAPKDTGVLERSIRPAVARDPENIAAFAISRYRGEDPRAMRRTSNFMQALATNPQSLLRKRSSKTKRSWKRKRAAKPWSKRLWYAAMVEYGHKAGKRATNKDIGLRRGRKRTGVDNARIAIANASRKSVAAQPFLRPAMEESRSQVIQTVRLGIEKLLK